MKSHGMIFGAFSMPKILDGTKTMTRRVVAFHNSTLNGPTNDRVMWDELDFDHAFVVVKGISVDGYRGPYLRVAFPKTDGFQGLARHECQCRVYPRVQVGDEIWTRETWCRGAGLSVISTKAADGGERLFGDSEPAPKYIFKADGAVLPPGVKWGSPLFQPYEASRASMPVRYVVAQRVQDISSNDIVREGLSVSFPEEYMCKPRLTEAEVFAATEYMRMELEEKWINLWNSINANRGHQWSKNDLVWGYRWSEVKK